MKHGTCHDCGDRTIVTQVDIESSHYADYYVCEDCYHAYHQCVNCEEKDHEDHMIRDNNQNRICSECQDVYKSCDNCEEHFHEDHLMRDDNGNYYCEGCRAEDHGNYEEHYRAEEGDRQYEMRRDAELF